MNGLLPFYFLRLVGSLANQFLTFSVPLLVYGLTGSLAWSGFAFFIEWLPRIFSFPLAGAAVDRYGPKPVYITADAIRLIAAAATFAALIVMPDQGHLFVVGLAVVAGFFFEQAFISVEKIARQRAPLDRMHRVQTVLTGIDQATQLAGPALAGVTAALLDVEALIAVTAAAFTVSFVVILAVQASDLRPAGGRSATSLIGELAVGWRTFVGIRKLVFLVLLTNLVNLLFGLILIIGPAMTTTVFGRPESHMGIVYTVAGIAGLSATVATRFLADRIPVARIGVTAFAFACLGMMLVGVAPAFWIYVLGAAMIVAMDGMFTVYIRTERARLIPADRFGSTVGLIVLLNFLPMPLAGLLVALAAEPLGLQWMLLAVGGISVLAAVPLIPPLLRPTVPVSDSAAARAAAD